MLSKEVLAIEELYQVGPEILLHVTALQAAVCRKVLCIQEILDKIPQTDYQRALNIMSNDSEEMGVSVPELRHPSLPYTLMNFQT